jgi:serine/threonine protein kinase
MRSTGRTTVAYVYNKPFMMANGEHFIKFLLRRGWTEGERLGAGATAAVFKMGESHIIKVVNLAHGNHSQFKHEVQMLKLLSEREHPMAMKIDAAAIIGPVGYILSPYVPGELLTTWLAAHENPDERATVYNSILAAIREMHWAQIIHRDIKPENIWVLPDLSVILLDFGIAARRGVRVPGAGTRKYRRGAHIPVDEEPQPNLNYFALGKIIEEFPPHGKFLVDGRRHLNLKTPGISRVAARFRSPNSSERRRRTRRRAATV